MSINDNNPRPPDDDSFFKGDSWFSGKIVLLLASLTPSCQTVIHLLSEEMDRPLPWLTRVRLRIHFLFCCYCERYNNQLHFLRKVLRHSDLADALGSGPALSLEAKLKLKRHLHGLMH